MFDFGIGYTEIVVIALVAVIVIGPKDLPKVLRAFGRTMQKVRGMAREFQGHLDQAMREAGVDDIKKEINNLKTMNPVEDVKNSIAASNPIPAVTKDLSTELKKQDDDFKKYFGEIGAKSPEPPAAPPAEAAQSDATAAKSETPPVVH